MQIVAQGTGFAGNRRLRVHRLVIFVLEQMHCVIDQLGCAVAAADKKCVDVAGGGNGDAVTCGEHAGAR